MTDRSRTQPRIVVVGPCASGKSTLAGQLRALGHDVRVSGQEHSSIHNLWQKLDHDVLVALEIDLETLRARRSESWPQAIYDLQQERLQGAYDAANVVIDTASTPPDQVLAQVLATIESDEFSSPRNGDPTI